MATKKSNGYESGSHQSNYGNGHVAILKHMFTEADKDGDVLMMGRFGFNRTIHRLTVSSPSGLGDGVSVDLGYIGLESGDEKLDYFKAGIDVSGAGRKELNCAPFYMQDMGVGCNGDLKEGDGRGEIHDVALTVHGTPAVDSCVFVHLEYIHNGH